MDMFWLMLALTGLLLCLAAAAVHLSSWSVQHTLRDLGIETPPASRIFGHFHESVGLGIFGVQKKYYPQFKHRKVFGWYEFRAPIVWICDPDLLREVMVKHFNCFADRRLLVDFDPPFRDSLPNIFGDQWKRVRAAISPTFSSGRLKKMSTLVDGKVKSLLLALYHKQESGEELELKDLMSSFTMDTLASTIFGLDVDTLGGRDAEFSRVAKRLLRPNILSFLAGLVSPRLGRLFRRLGFPVQSRPALKVLSDMVDSAITMRESSGEVGKMNDFLDVVLTSDGDSSGLSREEIQGQAILFIFAGYDTVSTALAFTLFLLAVHPECQRRVQQELDQAIPGGPGTVPDYEKSLELPYLDQCISEALRMFPPAGLTDRACVEDVTIHGIRFQKGMMVSIPVYALHNDPDIWDEPQHFRPERFDPEVKAARHQFAYMPFGHGPRNCLGMRLAQLELRLALAATLRLYDVLPCSKTVYPVRLNKLQTVAEDGLWVRLERR